MIAIVCLVVGINSATVPASSTSSCFETDSLELQSMMFACSKNRYRCQANAVLPRPGVSVYFIKWNVDLIKNTEPLPFSIGYDKT